MSDLPTSDWDNERYITGRERRMGRVTSTISFDEVMTNIERYSTELRVDVKMPPRGSTAAFDLMCVLRDALMKRASETDDTVMADLSPQLIGLEGRTVQATDLFGETREFVVDRWADMPPGGLPPVHVEVRATGHRIVAQREYESVEVVK